MLLVSHNHLFDTKYKILRKSFTDLKQIKPFSLLHIFKQVFLFITAYSISLCVSILNSIHPNQIVTRDRSVWITILYTVPSQQDTVGTTEFLAFDQFFGKQNCSRFKIGRGRTRLQGWQDNKLCSCFSITWNLEK